MKGIAEPYTCNFTIDFNYSQARVWPFKKLQSEEWAHEREKKKILPPLMTSTALYKTRRGKITENFGEQGEVEEKYYNMCSETGKKSHTTKELLSNAGLLAHAIEFSH